VSAICASSLTESVEDPYGGMMGGGMGKMMMGGMGMGGMGMMMGGMGKMMMGNFCPKNTQDRLSNKRRVGLLQACTDPNQLANNILNGKNTPLPNNYKGVQGKMQKTPSGALAWKGKMDVDCDGAPTCKSIDPDGQATTSHTYQGKALDASKMNYMVLPGGLAKQMGLQLGDVAAVSYNGKTAYAIYGDVGPKNKAGEASMHLAQQLGIPSSPTKGGTSSGVSYIVFPHSAGSYSNPYDYSQLEKAGNQLLQQHAN
jgi:hypothetical protein